MRECNSNVNTIRELLEFKLFERVEGIANRKREQIRFYNLVFGIKLFKILGKEIFGSNLVIFFWK